MLVYWRTDLTDGYLHLGPKSLLMSAVSVCGIQAAYAAGVQNKWEYFVNWWHSLKEACCGRLYPEAARKHA